MIRKFLIFKKLRGSLLFIDSTRSRRIVRSSRWLSYVD